jgi:hypothetical protein
MPHYAATVNPEPNHAMLAALDEIANRQLGRRYTDGSQTDAIIREGRGGGMYGDDLSQKQPGRSGHRRKRRRCSGTAQVHVTTIIPPDAEENRR